MWKVGRWRGEWRVIGEEKGKERGVLSRDARRAGKRLGHERLGLSSKFYIDRL